MSRHAPPTNRSLYLSVAASTLRFAIIVALVVGGVVLIDQAFPEASTPPDGNGGLSDGDGIEVTDTPSPSVSETEAPPQNEPSPTIAGTLVVVVNAAAETDLAGSTQDALIARYDYEAAGEPDTAPSTMPTTTIYFRTNRDRIEANYLAEDFFARRCDLENVRIQRLREGADVPDEAQLAIYVGLDFAQVADPDAVC